MTSLKKSSYEKVSEEALHPYNDAKSTYANFFEIKNKKELDSLERELSTVRQAELISEISATIQPSILENLYSFRSIPQFTKNFFLTYIHGPVNYVHLTWATMATFSLMLTN